MFFFLYIFFSIFFFIRYAHKKCENSSWKICRHCFVLSVSRSHQIRLFGAFGWKGCVVSVSLRFSHVYKQQSIFHLLKGCYLFLTDVCSLSHLFPPSLCVRFILNLSEFSRVIINKGILFEGFVARRWLIRKGYQLGN